MLLLLLPLLCYALGRPCSRPLLCNDSKMKWCIAMLVGHIDSTPKLIQQLHYTTNHTTPHPHETEEEGRGGGGEINYEDRRRHEWVARGRGEGRRGGEIKNYDDRTSK